MIPELKSTVELLSNVSEAFTAAVFLFDQERKGLYLACHHTLSKNLKKDVVLTPGQGVVGWVAKSGQAINIPNFDRNINSLGIYGGREEIKSFMAVPLGDEGVICVDSKQTYLFTDKDMKILEGFAQVFLHLLKYSRAKEREKRYAKMLKLLHDLEQVSNRLEDPQSLISRVLSELKVFAGVELGFFTSPDSKAKRYRVELVDGTLGPNFCGTSYPIDSGLVGWVYRERKPLVLKRVREVSKRSFIFSPEDPVKRFRSFMGVPLEAWGRTVGVLGLVGFENRDWTTDEVAVLTMTGRWVTAALKTWDTEGGARWS